MVRPLLHDPTGFGKHAPALFGANPPPFYPMAEFGDFYFPATNLHLNKLYTLEDLDPVDSWVCAVTGAELTQESAVSRPLYVADRLGYPAVQGDGGNDFLISVGTPLALTGPTVSTDYAIVVVSSSPGVIDRSTAATGNAGDTRRLSSNVRNSSQYRYLWRTSGGESGWVNGVGRLNLEMDTVITSVSGGSLRQQSTSNTITVAVAPGDWECDRFTVCARDNGTWNTNAYIHAVLIAKGPKALALFNDPSNLFAAAATEWGI